MNQPSNERPPGAPSPKNGGARRPYRTPELVEYGSIAAKTLSVVTGSFIDAMSMVQPMVCY